MPTDDILIRFKADTGQLKAEFDEIQAGLRKVGQEEKKQGDQAKVTTKEIIDAAARRNALLKAEISVLKQLEEQKKKAFTVKDISEFNSRIAESNKNISLLKGGQEKVTSGNSLLSSSFAKLGPLIAAAFSVDQIIAFGKETIHAFQESEKAATQLKAAVETVANEGVDAFQRLTKQALELQKVSIFSDEQIKQSQTAQLNFGLTSRQVETLTNRIVDFASRTGKSLDEATDIFLRALEGQQRGLILSGAKFDDTGSRIGNFNALLKSTEKFAGGAATALQTSAGEIKNVGNQIDDVNEQIGERLQGFELIVAKFKLRFAEVIDFLSNGQEIGRKITQFLINPITLLAEAFFGKEKPSELPKELDATGKAVDSLAEKMERIHQASLGLNKSIKGFTDAQLEAELKRLNSLAEANTIAVKDRVDLINKELEERKKNAPKILEQLQKDAKETRDAQEALRKFTLKSLQDNLQDEETLRIEDAAKNIADERERNQTLLQITLEFNKKRKDLLEQFGDASSDINKKIAEDNLAIQKANEKDTVDLAKETFDAKLKLIDDAFAKQLAIIEGSSEPEKKIEAAKLQATKKYLEDKIQAYKDAGEKIGDLEKQLAEVNKEIAKDFRDKIIDSLKEISDAAQAFTDILNANTESQIQTLTDAAQRQTDALDKQQENLQALFDNHKISQEEFDKRSKALAKSREKAEKDSQEKIKQLKTEEAKRDKELALFKIALEVALAIAEQNFVKAAIAGAELIAVAAKPLPSFYKGTKGKQGSGLARVGERGEEIVFLPSGAKVLPARQTKQNAEFIDAMFDGTIDQLIHKNYVLPALKLQSPNVNINIDYKKLAKANQQRSSISIDNLHELAEMFDHNPRRVI